MLRFDPDQWFGKVSLPRGERIQGGFVIGPADACNVVVLRQFLRRLFYPGPGVPADVFVFAVGEAPDRSWTKVGGVPHLRRSRAWPTGKTGAHLPFLAQFNFTESRDIVGDLIDGDILLLFGDHRLGLIPDLAEFEEPEIVLLWEKLDNGDRLVTDVDIPTVPQFAAFYGARWRTENFPDVYNWRVQDPVPYLDRTTIELGEYLHNPFYIYGTQIGRAPNWPGYRTPEDEQLSFICCLYSVFPHTEGPYPFLNHPDPIRRSGSLGAPIYDSKLRFFGLGSEANAEAIYVYRDERGDLHCTSMLAG